MRVASTFSGVGGIDLGFQRAGHEVVVMCEWDKFRRQVLRRHWPDVPLYKDVRDVVGKQGMCDILVGGFPCQDVSIAGRRGGLTGKRTGLFFEFIRIAKETAAPWLLIENVPGLFSSNKGEDFSTVLDEIQDAGYVPEVNVLDSRMFGVPQRRRRVFLLCQRVEDGRKRRTPTSVSMLSHSLTSTLQLLLGEAVRRSDTEPTDLDSASERTADGLRKRTKLFGATSMKGWNEWLEDFIELTRSYPSAQHILESPFVHVSGEELPAAITSGTSPAMMGYDDQNLTTEELLRRIWADLYSLVSEYTTSTSTSWTIERATFTSALASVIISSSTEPWTRSYPSCWNEESCGLTALQGVINYARQTGSESTGEMGRTTLWVALAGWAERVQEQLAGCPVQSHAAEVLLEPQSGGGHPEEGRKKRKSTTRSTRARAEAPSPAAQGVNPQGWREEDPDAAFALDQQCGQPSQAHSTNLVLANALDRQAGGADDNSAQANHLVPVVVGAQGDHSHNLPGSEGFDASEDGTGRGTPVVAVGNDRVAPCLRAGNSHNNSDPTMEASMLVGPEEAATLTSGVATGEGVSVPGRRQEDDLNLVAHPVREKWRAEEDVDTLVSGPITARYMKGVNTTMDDGAMVGPREMTALAFNWQSGGSAMRLQLSEEEVTSLIKQQTPAVFVSENQRAEVRETDYARQLTGGGGKPGQGYPLARFGEEGGYVRRLTPTECERLQGFPDGWTLLDGNSLADAPSWYEDPYFDFSRLLCAPREQTPDGRRYSAMGDAVTVPVSRWIAGRLMELAG